MNRRDFLKRSLMATAAGGLLLSGATSSLSEARGAEHGKEEKMKILVLTGSPREHGNSNTLADHFIKGAQEAGHEVFRFDAALRNVHPCTACNSCGMNGPCVFDDDFNFIREHIISADPAAFVTPMYYFGISARLKAVIDRFYAINGSIRTPKQAVLMMTYADISKRKESPILTHYDVLPEYLGWTDAVRIIAPGVWAEGSISRTEFPKKAYLLGRALSRQGASSQ